MRLMQYPGTLIDGSGDIILPATQRPDGSWRKEVKVKKGYIPQEVVPLYECKGKKEYIQYSKYPPGLHPDEIKKIEEVKQGLTLNTTNKSKNKKQSDPISTKHIIDSFASLNINSKTLSNTKHHTKETPAIIKHMDIEAILKKVRNLKKKLRQIESLKEKLDDGDYKELDKEQMEKIERQNKIEDEIENLENLLESK
ncbi:unnamed protein product [Gordionus sp. m RMFG-2023]|uniref:partner of Y14 and mago-like n=1 Tax=Gordionus sp. m RMFG-2023 TaxID=3053472 RepID=UPI0030E35192